MVELETGVPPAVAALGYGRRPGHNPRIYMIVGFAVTMLLECSRICLTLPQPIDLGPSSKV